MKERFATYAEFWPHYLRKHSKPRTRAWHYAGTALALLLVIAVALSGQAWLLLLAVTVGYLFAWLGHALVEGNRPATFTHAFWSLISDFRMFAFWICGALGPELERANVNAPSEPAASES